MAGPNGREVLRYLHSGGHLLLGTPSSTAAMWDTPLYRDALGLEYVRRWDRSYAFTLSTAREAKQGRTFEIETAQKGEPLTIFRRRPGAAGDGVEPFAVLPGGQWVGARVARRDTAAGKPYRAVVLGFFLADVKGAENRQAILKEALAFLDHG